MIMDYSKAKKLGEREYRRRLVKGQYPYLPSLEEMVSGVDRMPEISLGLAEIPLDMVVGTRTTGRQNAFAANFMPLVGEDSEFAAKWSNLYDSQVEEGIRDPVKVYEFMNRFYVQEGNKRISVLNYVGAASVLANIIRIRPPRTDSEQSRTYYEYLDFYQVTKSFEIVFSAPGRYNQLARILQQNLHDPWPEELLEKLHAGFIAFKEIYLARGGQKLNLTVGDALLIYLSVYSLDSLTREGRDVIGKRLAKLRHEYIAASQPDRIALIESRKDAETPAKKLAISKSPVPVLPRQAYSPAHPLRVAFIHEKNPDDSGWVYGHMLGMNHLKEAFGSIVETICFYNCSNEEEIGEAFDTILAENCRVVFTTYDSLRPYALRFAVEHPEIKILHCSVNQSNHALRFYYGKMYEAKFLLGALAASMEDDHRIGYVAGRQDVAAIPNINAFALGAQLIDPYCKVVLQWVGSEPRNESISADSPSGPVKNTAKQISMFSDVDMIRPEERIRRYGVFELGENGEQKRIAAPIWNWGMFYELVVRKVIDGTYDSLAASKKDYSLNYWLGLESGLIDIILSDDLPRPVYRLYELLRKGVIEGRVSPFEGVIYDRDGGVHGTEGVSLTPAEIMSMDWLAENVCGADISDAGDANDCGTDACDADAGDADAGDTDAGDANVCGTDACDADAGDADDSGADVGDAE